MKSVKEPPRAPVCIIAGAGPQLGLAIAARFAAEGFAVYPLSRSPERLSGRIAPLRSSGLSIQLTRCDLSDPHAIDVVLRRIRERHGRCDVLIYNAFAASSASLLKLDAETLIDDLRVGVGGALTLVQKTVEGMHAAGGGTILFTGCAEASRLAGNAPSLGIGKAALQALANFLVAELRPAGIRVGIVTVGPAVRTTADYVRAAAQRYWEMFLASERAYEPESHVLEC
jgi:short-subunit dehydrogenase